MDEEFFSFSSRLTEEQFDAYNSLYVQEVSVQENTRSERRKLVQSSLLRFEEDELNTRKNFIVDQLFLALDYSFSKSFSLPATRVLIEQLDKELYELANDQNTDTSVLSGPEAARKVYLSFEQKIKTSQDVHPHEWKSISEYLNLRLYPDLQAYAYFFRNSPKIDPYSRTICIDLPLSNQLPLE